MSLLKSASTISLLTLLSRITGLVRDVIIARAFGAGPLTDAFWVAFRIPNLLRRLFAEGAFTQAFVPVLGAVKARSDTDTSGVRMLLDRLSTLLTLALALVALAGVAGAPLLVMVVGSGFMTAGHSTDTYDAAVWMTRIMFPYIACMSLAALAAGVLNTWRRYGLPAFTPVLLNVAMIGAALWLSPLLTQPIYGLAAGVMAGGVLQLATQWWGLQRLGLRPRLCSGGVSAAWADSDVRRILRQMAPAILGVSVAQLSILINTNIATWLPGGSVTWLSMADRLMEFPSALLGVALGTVLLPTLSAAHARQDVDGYSGLIDWGLRLLLMLGLPAALGMALLSDGLVAGLFHQGAFTDADVQQTAYAVSAYAVGLLGLLAIKVLAPGFYARQDMRTPVKVAVATLVFTQLLNLVSVPLLAHAGLALSVGLGATANALALYLLLRRQGAYRPTPGWGRFMLRLLPGLLLLGLLLGWASHTIDWLALGSQPWLRIALLLAVVGACVVVYFASLYATGMRPKHFTRPAN